MTAYIEPMASLDFDAERANNIVSAIENSRANHDQAIYMARFVREAAYSVSSTSYWLNDAAEWRKSITFWKSYLYDYVLPVEVG